MDAVHRADPGSDPDCRRGFGHRGQRDHAARFYSLGLGIPFVLAALFTQTLLGSLPRMRKAGRYLQVFAGGVMILMGLAMMTGQMTRLAFWLLDTFPALGSIG
jgi:hypothetical protein